jgi:hypothetical protein
MTSAPESIADRLHRVQERIVRAAGASGRRADEVRVVAVTKYARPEEIAELVRCGSYVLGENRVQEAERKQAALTRLLEEEHVRRLQWHMIGHLQTNKAARVVSWATMIQSVDSLRLAEHIDRAAAQRGRSIDCLVQVNISQEANKFGAGWEDAAALVDGVQKFSYITCVGVMGIAPQCGYVEGSRPYFARLRRFWEDINQLQRSRGAPVLPILSMGMSNDFEVAVQEGATMVRIGSAIFGG